MKFDVPTVVWEIMGLLKPAEEWWESEYLRESYSLIDSPFDFIGLSSLVECTNSVEVVGLVV